MGGSSLPFFGRPLTAPDRVRETSDGAAIGHPPPRTREQIVRGLFDDHHGSIWRLLRRLGVRPDQLDDATQEVFWVAVRKLDDISPGSEHAFLYGVALRVAANETRRQARADIATEGEILARIADLGPSPEERADQRRTRALLDVVLDAMPTELRTVFVLCELEGLEVRAVAVLENIPIGTASSRLRRARELFSEQAKRLRAALRSRGGL
jgi:RNA polymerase sigma-70 factor, ECF subfamily